MNNNAKCRVIEERLHQVIRQHFQNAKQNNQGASEELLDNIKDELLYEIKVSSNSIKLNDKAEFLGHQSVTFWSIFKRWG